MSRPLRSFAILLAVVWPGWVNAQTYSQPAPGDFGGAVTQTVNIATLANPIYPTANGASLTISVYHPGASLNPALPTIFFAHGFTSPVGDAASYSVLLEHLAGRGYNVVFSPYEGGLGLNIPRRFDELTTGFDAAVSLFGLNTAQVGFVGHSYGGGFLPAVIQHKMMGAANQFRAGTSWGSTAAFMFAMAPAYALSGGGDISVSDTQTIAFPANLNVVEQVFLDDTSINDPRLALDIFQNITTPAAQKDFLIVHGDPHGTPDQIAGHFLPNTPTGGGSASLQAWAILRHLDALAAWTFTGDSAAGVLALGNGAPEQTYMGLWSDNVPVTPLTITDSPSPDGFATGPWTSGWTDPGNPRRNFALVPEPSVPALLAVAAVGLLATRRPARRMA